MRRCRSKKWGPISRTWTFCDLDDGHADPHFHDGIETYLVWARRGLRGCYVDGGLLIIERSGQTAQADPWVLRLVIKAREGRLERARAYESNLHRLRTSKTLRNLARSHRFA
jgi:hypothetical protein